MSDLLAMSVSAFPAVAAGALSTHVFLEFSRRRKKHIERISQLKEAASLLKEHYAAVESFVEDAAAPDSLKELLLNFSEAISNEKIAKNVLLPAVKKPLTEPLPGTTFVIKELDGLRKHRPMLARCFERAVGTGVFAMFLRWHETATVFEDGISKVAVDSTREIAFATQAAQAQSGRTIDSLLGNRSSPVFA